MRFAPRMQARASLRRSPAVRASLGWRSHGLNLMTELRWEEEEEEEEEEESLFRADAVN